MASASGLPSYLYPVRHTFIDDPVGRLDSLEGFLHERQAFSCPVSRVEEPGSGVEGSAPKAASESAHDKSTAAPQASEARSHEAEESDCSTVDTGSLREVPHTPEMEPAHAFPMQMSLTGLLSQAASSSEVLTPEPVAPMATSSSFFSSMAGYAAPFSPGAGAYYDMGLHQPLQTSENLHQEFLATDFEHPLPQPVPPSPVPHPVPPGAPVPSPAPLAPVGPVGQLPGPAPAVPPPCEPAPQVPPTLLPQVPSHAATQQNGSAPQVLKLEDALAPAASVAVQSANAALEETRHQHLEVQQAAQVAAAQAVSASHEEQVAAANAFASASGLALQQDAKSELNLPSAGSTGHHLGQCRPCAFWTTKGCSSGQECQFCHLCAPGERNDDRRRNAPSSVRWRRCSAASPVSARPRGDPPPAYATRLRIAALCSGNAK